MYQIDNSTAAAAQPASTPAGSAGFFTDGNPAGGVAATIVPAEWLNAVMMELINIVTAGGQIPAKNVFNQVLTALNAMHSPVVGTRRNARMNVGAASSSATFTADEIVFETVLGGQTYRLANFNKTINLSVTGAGGMDVGVAPVTGYVAVYAIYNPATGASALLATNATSASQPEVYGGANMPVGYTASALVAVWRTASSQFTVGYLQDRRLNFPPIQVLSVSAVQASPVSFSIAGAVPLNARRVKLFLAASSSASSSAQQFQVSGNSASSGAQVLFAVTAAAGAGNACNGEVALITPQTLYYQSSNTAGTPSYTLSIVEMEF